MQSCRRHVVKRAAAGEAHAHCTLAEPPGRIQVRWHCTALHWQALLRANAMHYAGERQRQSCDSCRRAGGAHWHDRERAGLRAQDDSTGIRCGAAPTVSGARASRSSGDTPGVAAAQRADTAARGALLRANGAGRPESGATRARAGGSDDGGLPCEHRGGCSCSSAQRPCPPTTHHSPNDATGRATARSDHGRRRYLRPPDRRAPKGVPSKRASRWHRPSRPRDAMPASSAHRETRSLPPQQRARS